MKETKFAVHLHPPIRRLDEFIFKVLFGNISTFSQHKQKKKFFGNSGSLEIMKILLFLFGSTIHKMKKICDRENFQKIISFAFIKVHAIARDPKTLA